jgi:tRNA pseudouridine55 synthase
MQLAMTFVNGLLNINKPGGATSRDVVDRVCRVAGTRQVGHAGTLDPLATGVLVVCIGWTTRLVPYIQQLHKRYDAEFLLGQTSDTDDVTGIVTPVAVDVIPSREQIERQLPAFVGSIQQVPPQYSAVRVAGRRAHQLARKGESVELVPRTVEVFGIDLVEYAFPKLRLQIECGSGTYVRSMGRDLGESLGCGAVMSRLVRTAVGDFELGAAVSLDELATETIESRLLAPGCGVRHLPMQSCSGAQLTEIAFGRPIPFTGTEPADGTTVALVNSAGDLVALAEFQISRRMLQPRQVFFRQ